MNKLNSYLSMEKTKEKKKKEIETKKIKIVNFKISNEPKRNNNNFQINFTHRNSNKRNINFSDNRGWSTRKSTLKNKKTLDYEDIDNKILNTKINTVYNEDQFDKNISMISFYDDTKKKIKIHKFNSIAYIKKRPNDLIKNNNLNRSTINSKYINSSLKRNGRCYSCTNVKHRANMLNNDTIKGKVSFYRDIIDATKKSSFKKVNPFINKDFSFKDKEDFLERKILSEFVGKMNQIINKNLNPLKVFLIGYLKKNMKMKMYKVSFQEFKLLEELKSLGVTNKNQLNLFLKDIYFEIKGKN